jgi:hypothetical protein
MVKQLKEAETERQRKKEETSKETNNTRRNSKRKNLMVIKLDEFQTMTKKRKGQNTRR